MIVGFMYYYAILAKQFDSYQNYLNNQRDFIDFDFSFYFKTFYMQKRKQSINLTKSLLN